ncbi:Met-10+ like-protein [Toxoplasma gondii VAND]|uniref:Met-10+ like-protein n=1 Tax=Toxoplasma gondii VAND TaxID=933077 RepID=A0A086PWU4_TOXGO|nr:Met-10+ like-protein [Toxoplasma gondii VAND]
MRGPSAFRLLPLLLLLTRPASSVAAALLVRKTGTNAFPSLSLSPPAPAPDVFTRESRSSPRSNVAPSFLPSLPLRVPGRRSIAIRGERGGDERRSLRRFAAKSTFSPLFSASSPSSSFSSSLRSFLTELPLLGDRSSSSSSLPAKPRLSAAPPPEAVQGAASEEEDRTSTAEELAPTDEEGSLQRAKASTTTTEDRPEREEEADTQGEEGPLTEQADNGKRQGRTGVQEWKEKERGGEETVELRSEQGGDEETPTERLRIPEARTPPRARNGRRRQDDSISPTREGLNVFEAAAMDPGKEADEVEKKKEEEATARALANFDPEKIGEDLTLTFLRVPERQVNDALKRVKKFLFHRRNFKSVRDEDTSTASAFDNAMLADAVALSETAAQAEQTSPREEGEKAHATGEAVQSGGDAPADDTEEARKEAKTQVAKWKRILLSEEVQEDLRQLPSSVREWLSTQNFTVGRETVHLSYKHLTAEEAMKKLVPADLDMPRRYETVGHIAHLNLREHLLPYRFLIARLLLDKQLGLATVVNKTGIASQWRELQFEHLGGEPRFVARLKENDMHFEIDYERVYWNSRLAAEREKITAEVPRSSIVLDCFAGVGAFSLFLAQRRSCLVLANDFNPNAVLCMKKNRSLNKVRLQRPVQAARWMQLRTFQFGFFASSQGSSTFLSTFLSSLLVGRWLPISRPVHSENEDSWASCSGHAFVDSDMAFVSIHAEGYWVVLGVFFSSVFFVFAQRLIPRGATVSGVKFVFLVEVDKLCGFVTSSTGSPDESIQDEGVVVSNSSSVS